MLFLIFCLLLMFQFIPNLFQKTEGNPAQCPITKQSSRCHQLILINSYKLLGITKKDFNLPTCANMCQQRLDISCQIRRGPIACKANGIFKILAYNDKFAAIQLSYACINNMYPYLLFRISRLATPLIRAFWKRSDVVRQFLPFPFFRIIIAWNAQRTIAPDACCNVKSSITCSFPDFFGTVPTIQKNMCHCPRRRSKILNLLDHKVNFAYKWYFLLFCGFLLLVEKRF